MADSKKNFKPCGEIKIENRKDGDKNTSTAVGKVRPETQIQPNFQNFFLSVVFLSEVFHHEIRGVVDNHIEEVTTKVAKYVLPLQVKERKYYLYGPRYSQEKTGDLRKTTDETSPSASVGENDRGGGEELRGYHYVGVDKRRPDVG